MNKVMRRATLYSLLPLIIVIILIYLIPVLNVIMNAFTGFTGSSAGKFVGLANLAKIQAEIPKTTLTTLIWTIGSVVPAIILGLILALLLQQDFRLKRFFVAMNLVPYSIPLIIVASFWLFVFNQNFGILNGLLLALGIISKPITFLNYSNALTSVIIARIWRATPFAFINFYAALTTIPTDLYEAASVDGATPSQKFWYITLPNLRSVLSTTLIVLTVWTFLVFDIIYGMTGGGPVDATRIISIQIYKELFHMKDLGTASMWSLIAIVILTIITIIYWALFERKEATG
ncbi:MAG: sugar ABC transporter permease [Caldilineaceae bacterium]|nr:sugar ABC transporter permease [Caldilineaceae bacterium]